MGKSKTDPLQELKKIAKIRVDKERHKLAAIRDQAARLEQERQAIRKQINDIGEGKETSPEALMNAFAYLDTLAKKAQRLDAERHQANERTQAQRERIKAALASKIRVDGMGEK